MITRIATAHLFVSDYDRSKAFFVEKLGFEEQMDVPMGPDQRWVQVAPRGTETSLVLAKAAEGAPGYDQAKVMMGSFAPFILAVDDMEATHRELTAKGVEFGDAPSKQEWGWWATIKDPDGNLIGLHANA